MEKAINEMTKAEFVAKQMGEATNNIRAFVRCGCLRKLWMYETYKCLYCGEWYCDKCAEIHFGETVEEHKAKHITLLINGNSFYLLPL